MNAIVQAARGSFVEASAGTGKTTALVEAIVEAIASGVPVERIVAVTFTHQAAGEMKLRVRKRLAEVNTPVTLAALQFLDRAFIGTIHSFCAALIRQRPVEACVDPDFQELDESEARRFFGRVFRSWITKRLQAPALRRALARLAWQEERGLSPLESLEYAAWQLTEWRDHDAPWQKRPFNRKAGIQDLLDQAWSMFQRWPENEFRNGRPLLRDIVKQFRRAQKAGAFDPDEAESELIALPRILKWVDFDKNSPAREPWRDLLDSIARFRRQADAELAADLRDELWAVVTEYQRSKCGAGLLDFTDLLLYGRDLLRHREAREDLRNRYDRVFVDEFQDTDPLQAELLTLLADSDKLFVVGDPKQSIYRFRRADPGVYETVRGDLLGSGAIHRELSVSYRSTDEIQAFVNAAFGSMDRYLPLTGGLPAPLGQPSIVALPVPCAADDKDKLIVERSPGATAAFIDWLIHQSGWTVRTKQGGREPVRAEHICILFRRFMNNGVDLTQEYVRGLEARGIDHVLVGSKGLHAREEVGVLRAALRAIEWPDDELNEYAVLRGSLFAISDSTLFKYRQQGVDQGDPEFAPIEEARRLLRDLHRARNHRPIAETMRLLLEHVRGHAAFAFHKGGARRLANLHRLSEMARKADAGGTLSFREFVEYLEEEARGGEAAEAPVLEQKSGGVRMMTVHKAKGLEFPVVILADLSCKLARAECARYVDSFHQLCAQRLLHCAPWDLVEHEDEEARAESEEAVRLAYVAATRACDLLVASVLNDKPYPNGWLSPLYDAIYPPHPPRAGQSQRAKHGSHEVFWFDLEVLDWREPERETLEKAHRLQGTPEQILQGRQRYEGWLAQRQSVLAEGSVPAHRVYRVTEAELASEASDIPVELISVETLAVRPAGRRFGRLLHAILHSGGSSEAHGRRYDASQEEVRAADAAAQIVLSHPLLSGPAVRVLREYPLIVRLEDGRLIEGRADVVRDEGDHWTVIDYKTDFADKARYKRQLQLYAYALSRATGKPARGVLLEI